MKIPFSIDFKTQIESGEYKVETRDGRKARIIHWDLNCTSPIVAVMDAHIDLPGEIVDVFSVSGRAFDDLESPSDLFLVTPEPELTEFEKAIKEMMRSYVKMPDEAIKETAAVLLALARKELEPEVLERLDVAYKNQDEVVYENGKRDGKAEAEKDLALSWQDVAQIITIYEHCVEDGIIKRYDSAEKLVLYSKEVLDRFIAAKQQIQ